MAVILKKDEKIEEVVSLLPEGFNTDDFINKFKELFEKDWIKINSTYEKHLRKSKPEKSIPMPPPEKYLSNALKVWNKKKG